MTRASTIEAEGSGREDVDGWPVRVCVRACPLQARARSGEPERVNSPRSDSMEAGD